MRRIFLLLSLCFLSAQTVWAARAKVEDLARDPYASALVMDAGTGKVLFEENADLVVYPASVLKLMDLLVILEQVEQGKVGLDDMVQVSAEAAHMGGSQVYLDSREQFSVEDLLYALAVQSANDAAVALATHVAGSTEAFVDLMNRRAHELGMNHSHFYSVHGLPPGKGQKPDETTAADLAILSRELVKRPEIFTYTGTRERSIRDGKFIMRNHNHLLGVVEGCDGFKTGYFQAAGFSIVATAKRGNNRVVAIVMGSRDRKIRDAKAAELLNKGFALLPAKQEVAEAVSMPASAPVEKETVQKSPPVQPVNEIKTPPASSAGGWKMFFLGLAVGLALATIIAFYFSGRRSRKRSSQRGYL